MSEVTKVVLTDEPKCIQITQENKDLWLNALWARRDELCTIIDEWYDTEYIGELKETCEELCRVFSYIQELKEL